jgi:transcriptional regulator with XRE-family HTH domain
MRTGEIIRKVREAKKLTQEQLSTLTGLSKGFLSDVENDKRNTSSGNILRIANALNVSVDYLLGSGIAKPARIRGPEVFPEELSVAARKLNLSYAQASELLSAQRSIIAHRNDRGRRMFTAEDWIQFYNLIK